MLINFSNFYTEYVLSLFFFNILVYVSMLTLFFCLFFIFDLKYFKTLNELKGLANYTFATTSLIVLLLSIAGIPPLFGFVGKFLIFIFIFFKKQFVLIFFLIFFNFFAMYFYIQNLRFLVKKNNSKAPFIIKNNKAYINFSLLQIIVFLNFLNLFGLFFTEDFLIYINHIFNFLFIE